MSRAAIVERLVALSPRRVAIDGPDASGKTTFAADVANALGVPVLHTDDHLRPAEVRARTPYVESFDTAAIAAAAARYDRVVAEGVFLLRPELRGLWDLTVYLHVEPEETLRRALLRDVAVFGSATEVERRYRERYLPGQAAYREAVMPEEVADVVLDMTDPACPVVSRWR